MSRPTTTDPRGADEPASAGHGTQRVVPYFCPFCGEEDLRPEPEPRAAWRCVGCARVFVVSFVGLSLPW